MGRGGDGHHVCVGGGGGWEGVCKRTSALYRLRALRGLARLLSFVMPV